MGSNYSWRLDLAISSLWGWAGTAGRMGVVCVCVCGGGGGVEGGSRTMLYMCIEYHV